MVTKVPLSKVLAYQGVGFLADNVDFRMVLASGAAVDLDVNVTKLMDDQSEVAIAVNPNDPKAPLTNINGGQGADFISYTVNSPVRIEGGDGFGQQLGRAGPGRARAQDRYHPGLAVAGPAAQA